MTDSTDEISTLGALRAAGIPSSTVDRRCRPGGQWQRLLPGVVLRCDTEPTRAHLQHAALAYAGSGAVLTGADALLGCGMRPQLPAKVHVLLPAGRRVTSRQFVHIERTTRMPVPIVRDGLAFAPPVRAVLDAARQQRDRRALAALLAEALRRGACSLPELRHELDSGSQRGSATPRALLTELSANVHSFADRLARRLLLDSPLPPPQWQVPVSDAAGRLLGIADAWWEDVGLAWDFGASEFRVDAASSAACTARGHAFAANRIVLLRTPAAQLSTDPEGVRSALLRAYLRAGTRPRPAVHTAQHTTHEQLNATGH